MKKAVFYGSIYDNERRNYVKVVRQQFEDCADKAAKDKFEIGAWGFDVLVKDSQTKKRIEQYVSVCAERFLPGAKNVSKP